jgi:hypothetical protein
MRDLLLLSLPAAAAVCSEAAPADCGPADCVNAADAATCWGACNAASGCNASVWFAISGPDANGAYDSCGSRVQYMYDNRATIAYASITDYPSACSYVAADSATSSACGACAALAQPPPPPSPLSPPGSSSDSTLVVILASAGGGLLAAAAVAGGALFFLMRGAPGGAPAEEAARLVDGPKPEPESALFDRGLPGLFLPGRRA